MLTTEQYNKKIAAEKFARARKGLAWRLVKLSSLMFAQERFHVEVFLLDLCFEAGSTPFEHLPYLDAIIVVGQTYLGGYGWTEDDYEAAENLLEGLKID